MLPLRIEQLRFLDRGPIDLVIEPGECVALAGPSGCGKSLMLRAIADLDPHDGQVLLGDQACESLPAPAWRRQVGLLAAESQWWFDRVGEHFDLDGDAEDPRDSQDPGGGACRLWLERLGFASDVMTWEIRRLSTGEKQRLALVRLLCNRPRAILLDEPTASLDPDNVARVERLLAEERRRAALPVLWVTHDPQQIPRVADRGYRMDAGRLVEQVHP